MNKTAFLNCVDEILEGGTRIVRFDYCGEAQNVTIGSFRASHHLQLSAMSFDNRAVGQMANSTWLVGIDNNKDDRVWAWNIVLIQNFSALRPRHSRTKFVNWIVGIFNKLTAKPTPQTDACHPCPVGWRRLKIGEITRPNDYLNAKSNRADYYSRYFAGQIRLIPFAGFQPVEGKYKVPNDGLCYYRKIKD